MDIYAIIVTYNGTKWVGKCFESLINSNIPLKILVIDNGSTDGTPNIIKEMFPEIEVIETGQNLGFGKANNIGLKRVLSEQADYAFLLNQDAWIEPDSVEHLVNISRENKDFGVLSPIHLNGQGDAIDRRFQNYLSSTQRPGIFSDLYLNDLKKLYEVRFANAAAWLITLECIKEIGGFNPIFEHYGEDTDYVDRLHLSDYKIGVVTNSRIYHDRPQDGKMSSQYYLNNHYIQALRATKMSPPLKAHFLWRRIVANLFILFFVYLGKNYQIVNLIKIDYTTLKLRKEGVGNIFIEP